MVTKEERSLVMRLVWMKKKGLNDNEIDKELRPEELRLLEKIKRFE